VRIAAIGSGAVGQALADGFLKHGHQTMRGSRTPAKLADWEAKAGGTASTTNPIADAPPDHGVIRYFTSLDQSLMEQLQRLAPDARFVKAFFLHGRWNHALTLMKK